MKISDIVMVVVIVLVNPLNNYSQDIKAIVVNSIIGPGSECGNAILTDKHGDYYITGYLQEGAFLGQEEVNVNGDTDIFIAKYNTKGQCLWHKVFGGERKDPMMANEMGCFLSFDANSNLIVSGFFSGVIEVDSAKLISKGDEDIFILKISSNGELLWIRQMGGVFQDKPVQMELSSSGNLTLMGTYNDKICLGSIELSQRGTTSFICKLDVSNGSVIDGFSLMPIDGFKAQVFKIVENEHIAIAGICDDEIVIDKHNITISIVDRSGRVKNVNTFFYQGNLNLNSLTLNRQGDAMLIGNFDGVLEFSSVALHSNGAHDIFILKFDSKCNYIGANSYGGVNNEEAMGVIVCDDKKLLLGRFTNEIYLSNSEYIKSSGCDYFLCEIGGDGSLFNGSNLNLQNSHKIIGFDAGDNSLLFTGLYRIDDLQFRQNGKDDCMIGKIENLNLMLQNDKLIGLNSELSISPNPVETKFDIISKNNMKTWNIVKIIDAQGIEQITFDSNANDGYDISNLSTGLYLVRVHQKDGQIISIPVIKK